MVYCQKCCDISYFNGKQQLKQIKTLPAWLPAAILARLPRYIQTAISVLTLILLAWASGHLLFLVFYFVKRIKHGLWDSFRTSFAPTLQPQKLTETREIQASIINSLQETISDNERNKLGLSWAKLSCQLGFRCTEINNFCLILINMKLLNT